MSAAGRALRMLAERQHALLDPLRALRVRVFVARVKVVAAWSRADIEIDVAPTARIGRGVQVRFGPHTRNVLRLGASAWLDDGVRIMLLGGEIHLGDRVEIRRGCLLDVGGSLRLEADNVLSWGTVVHCAESVHLERFATAGEYTTLADSAHFFTDRHDHHRHNVKTGPIRLGENTWLGAKVTVGRGTAIGAFSVIGANSVVVDDVPDGHLASGVPARVVRRIAAPDAPTVAFPPTPNDLDLPGHEEAEG